MDDHVNDPQSMDTGDSSIFVGARNAGGDGFCFALPLRAGFFNVRTTFFCSFFCFGGAVLRGDAEPVRSGREAATVLLGLSKGRRTGGNGSNDKKRCAGACGTTSGVFFATVCIFVGAMATTGSIGDMPFLGVCTMTGMPPKRARRRI